MNEMRMKGSDVGLRVTCDGLHLQDRLFRVEMLDDGGMEVYEIQSTHGAPDTHGTCGFGVRLREGRLEYAWLDMQFRRGELRCSTRAEVEDDCSIAVRHNGVEWSHPTVDERIMLDGPSPMFDWVTAVMVLGVLDGEEWEVPTYIIDPDTGCLQRKVYYISRQGSRITIVKGLNPLHDSIIELEEGGLNPLFQRSGGYGFHWD